MLLLIKTYKYRLNICHAFFTPAYIIFNWKQNNKYEFFKDNKKKKTESQTAWNVVVLASHKLEILSVKKGGEEWRRERGRTRLAWLTSI